MSALSLATLCAQVFVGLATCAYALVKGSASERYASGIILVNFAVGAVGGLIFGQNNALVFRLVNDGLAAFGLLAVTLFFGNLWLGLAMLLYAGQFSLHAYYFVTDRNTGDHLHAVINNSLFAGILLCLSVGTTVSWRRQVRAAR